jgi:hypothetical protein
MLDVGAAAANGLGSLATGGTRLTALAVDSSGNTSEFSNCVTVTPVPVRLLALTADVVAAGIRIRWLLSADSDPAGFHVHRRTAGGTEPWARITGAPLRGVAGPSGIAGEHVDDEDAFPRAREYALETWDRSGARSWFGPVAATRRPAPLRVAARENPAQASALFTLDLPIGGPVVAAVYDASGRRVRELVRDALPAGRRDVPWDGRSDAGRPVAAGVYFLRVVAAGARAETRVVLTPP